ncbi:Hypothetical predicted protein [Olea europaea subsp. europaea]|uniref:Uncharacterized protein n=1 Tax=Olea europaea subsp. europaea TaxID=158383 RepID=A0A8S0SD70_OLEEU|nr:Hypothetical predicted protein [Olea europaea subsp. europaea]
MKLVAFLLISVMVCSCMAAAAPRRALVSSTKIHNAEQHVEELQGIAVGRLSSDNHHNIPRQYYGQWGSSSNGGDGGDTPNDIKWK